MDNIYKDLSPKPENYVTFSQNLEVNIISVCLGGKIIFKIKADGTVEGGENTEEAALVFAQCVGQHLKNMGWASDTAQTPAIVDDKVQIAVEALEPFAPVWAKLTGLSDGIDVRLDASFALQDATGRARGATCNPNLPKLTVGDFRKAHKALATLKPTAVKAERKPKETSGPVLPEDAIDGDVHIVTAPND